VLFFFFPLAYIHLFFSSFLLFFFSTFLLFFFSIFLLILSSSLCLFFSSSLLLLTNLLKSTSLQFLLLLHYAILSLATILFSVFCSPLNQYSTTIYLSPSLFLYALYLTMPLIFRCQPSSLHVTPTTITLLLLRLKLQLMCLKAIRTLICFQNCFQNFLLPHTAQESPPFVGSVIAVKSCKLSEYQGGKSLGITGCKELRNNVL
jgi:hypothetical protein